MMTFQFKTAAAPTAKVLIAAEGGSSCSLRGPDVPQYPAAFRELRTMGASGGQAAVRHNIQLKTFPVIQPLSTKPRDQKSLFTTFIVGGSPRFAKDDPPQANSSEERNLSGRHILFDSNCVRPERATSMIPPLPKDYHVHRTGNLHPFSLSTGLPHSHKTGPFILDCNEQFELTTSPAVPTTFVLNGRNTFPMGNSKLSRSKGNYPTYHLQTVKENQKSVRPERTRSMIPPLPKDYHVHRTGNLHPFSLSTGLPHSHKTGPFILNCNEQFELTTSPAVPATFVLNGRNTFPVGNSKLSRSKGNYPTYHMQTVKENQKSQTYTDPVMGAPQSFLHRISELASLQCETVRQERLKKMKKPRKPAS